METLAQIMANAKPVELAVESPAWPQQLGLDDFATLEVASRFVDSAKVSAEHALTAGVRLNRMKKVHEGKALTGQWKPEEQDLLRSGLVFAGAGLDAALKRLVTDWLDRCILASDRSAALFTSFSERYIEHRDTYLDRKALTKMFLAPSTRDFLLERYKESFTGGSLQSCERVGEVLQAMGVTDKALHKRLVKTGTLRAAFDARNQIVHELDLRQPDEPSTGGLAGPRVGRTMPTMKRYIEEVLSVATLSIRAAAVAGAGSA